jgi:hypothetical protein
MPYRFSITSSFDKERVMGDGRMGRSAATLLELVLGVAIVLCAVLGVARPILGPAVLGIGTGPVFGQYPSVPATIDPGEVRIRTEPGLPNLESRGAIGPGDAVELVLPTRTDVGVYGDLDLRQLLGLVGSEVLTGLVTMAVLVLLLRLVVTLRHGDPFVPANARRLYSIAAVVGIGGQAVVLLEAWGRKGVLEHPAIAPYVFPDVHVSIVPMLAGLGVAVAAEVFRQGAALREDVEGLV